MFKNWDLTHKNQISFFPKKSGDPSTLGCGGAVGGSSLQTHLPRALCLDSTTPDSPSAALLCSCHLKMSPPDLGRIPGGNAGLENQP